MRIIFKPFEVLYPGIQSGHEVWLVRHHGLLCQMQLIGPEWMLMWCSGFQIPTICHWSFLLSLFLYYSSSCRQIGCLVWDLVDCNDPITVAKHGLLYQFGEKAKVWDRFVVFVCKLQFRFFEKRFYYGYFPIFIEISFSWVTVLTIWVMVGRQTANMSLSVDVLIWSNSQLLFFIPIISLLTSSCVSGAKLLKYLVSLVF